MGWWKKVRMMVGGGVLCACSLASSCHEWMHEWDPPSPAEQLVIDVQGFWNDFTDAFGDALEDLGGG